MAAPVRLEESAVASMVERLVAALPVERIVLFGSYARGDYHEGSDVDLLIVVTHAGDIFERSREALTALAGCAGTLDVEPHVYTAEEYRRLRNKGNPLITRAEREGRVLYEQQRG